MFDLLIKNGELLGLGSGHAGVGDIAVKGNRIAKIGKVPEDEASRVIDAAGCIVSPGLIDFHLHLSPLAEIGVCGEAACFPSGVTTAVDCGSAGVGTYLGHRPALAASRLGVYTFLHVSSAGLATGSYLENADPAYFNRAKIIEHFERWGEEELIGLKIRQGKEIVGDLGLEPLRETIGIADELQVPVMVHCSNPPSSIDSMLDLLRPGDIITHAYQDNGGSILGSDGAVSSRARAARARGVLFDVANANIHFSFKVARQAISEGFLPDTISTDLTTRSLYYRPNVFNLLHVMSKYLNMGMSIEQVFERCTIKPAQIIGRKGLTATLEEGHIADIAVIRKIRKDVIFGDRVGETLQGAFFLKAMATIKDGMLVYRDQEF